MYVHTMTERKRALQQRVIERGSYAAVARELGYTKANVHRIAGPGLTQYRMTCRRCRQPFSSLVPRMPDGRCTLCQWYAQRQPVESV